jgi:hypothetical protein
MGADIGAAERVGWGRGSACTLASEHHAHCFQEHHEVEEQSMVLHVVQVELQLFLRIFDCSAVGVANLSPPRDPGLTLCRNA